MTENLTLRPEEVVKETDIVFDCPFCGKSLAIDFKGAGLTIKCTDCAKMVEVPIPEGMEIDDLDRTPDEQELNILHLRKALGHAEARIEALERELEHTRRRKRRLQDYRMEAEQKLAAINEKLEIIERAAERITDLVSDVHSAAISHKV